MQLRRPQPNDATLLGIMCYHRSKILTLSSVLQKVGCQLVEGQADWDKSLNLLQWENKKEILS